MSKNKRRYQTVVIGAGASGLMAAISAGKYSKKVLLLEKNPRPGKKLLSTGNGKCNFTNEKQGLSCFRGDDPAFVLPVLKQFGKENLISFLSDLGILPFERNGYYYPFSGQASSVLEVLEAQIKVLGIDVICGENVVSVKKQNDFFLVKTDSFTYQASTCVLCSGGLAAPATGSDGFGLAAARAFGHTIIPTYPALVPLLCAGKHMTLWAGVRARAKVTLLADRIILGEDEGEIQLTKDGISGIPVFQISRFASKALAEGKKVIARLNFLPQMTKRETEEILLKRCFSTEKNRTVGDMLVGLVHRKLHGILSEAAGLKLTALLTECRKEDIIRLSQVCSQFEVKITGTRGYDFAQTTAGGISTAEICPETMESSLMKGLYFAGEIVDIEGICGGYNLQWAFSSGFVAGTHASGEKYFLTEDGQ